VASVWLLHDLYWPDGVEPATLELTLVDNEGQLRVELVRLAELEPRFAHLYRAGDRERYLGLALGGPWGAAWWSDRSPLARLALVEEARVEGALEFICEGHPTLVPPDQLFPVAYVIEVAAHVFTHGELPVWVAWSR
jgi:hypothetical protein